MLSRTLPSPSESTFTGRPLDHVYRTPAEITTFLRVAIQITSALADFHQSGFIHKNIKPHNILVDNETGIVRFTDLGMASRVPREPAMVKGFHIIEGTLAYMSPEQTGRMNRWIDSRTDLYSLGVTFYQLLTGRLPFEASDALGWVHCHVARSPPAPATLDPAIPRSVSDVVLKLLAKAAEDRYQSAIGLRLDLERCLELWFKHGQIEPFPLGTLDVPERVQVPQRLYGREAEVESLLGVFDRIALGAAPELVLVSGYSGVGKSALVSELHRPIVRQRGVFVSGKFDQYKRHIPYATLAQAFQGLVHQILGESEASIKQWRAALCEALGPNGQLMVKLIPELELIIGPQPPVPELPPQEAQHRFQMVFRQLISVFARAEHPLVLFLDDLQWMDAGTLGLLADLATRPDVHYLLLVGAYRDNEVDRSHPLMRSLEAIKKAGGVVREIVLSPLSRDDVERLVADTLHGPRERVRPLSQLVFEKTGGNPFFTIQFLTALVDEELLRFEPSMRAWSWDLPRIHAKGYTDNVVHLMVGKLARLPQGTQDALKQFACLGNVADVGTLGLVLGQSAEALHASLEEAVRAGLVFRQEDSYTFLHDRVQEAAYTLIPEGSRAGTHLRIGRILLASLKPEAIAERIFDVVNQLNRGSVEVESPEERERIAELDLLAGKRAREATAHGSALRYFAAGAALLAEDRWERMYGLAFALELHRAECEFLTGALEAAEQRLEMLWGRAASIVDQAAITCLRVDVYTTLDRPDRAVAVCLDYLRPLGADWSPHPTQAEVRQEYERMWRQLDRDRIEDLVELPLMSDPAARATMEVLSRISPATLFTDENLMCLITLRSVNLSLEHGNSDASANAYAWLGMILGPYFADYATALRFGQLAVNLLDKRGLDGCKARVYLMFGNFIVPWARDIRSGQQWQRRTFEAATRVGDLTYASYSCNSLITNLFASGEPLAEVEREAASGLAFAQKAQFGLVVDIIVAQLRLVRMLRGETEDLTSFNGADFDEAAFEQHLEANPSLAIACCWYWIRKLQGRLYAGEHAAAVTAAAKAQGLLWTSRSFFEQAEYHFYAALAHAAACTEVPADQRSAHRDALAAHHRQLAIWAEHCPENFANRKALCAAEIARIEARDLDAERLYEEAIGSAQKNGFVQNEAIACELASRFYRARGLARIADTYLREARACYARWGADGKVRQLDRLHPRLIGHELSGPAATMAVRSEQLDLLSVIKASQSISGEILLANLQQTLIRIVLEAAGAQKGYLLRRRGEDLHLEIEAALEEGGQEVRVREADIPLSAAPLPSSIINYAKRTRERVLLKDAAQEARFSADPYIAERRPRSVLCLPLARQAELVGLLYLENNLATGAFTPERVQVLSLLASQAAISLESATLYAHLSQENAERKRAEEQVRKLNAELELRVAERTAQLVSANKELEAFSYSVSHDLRAPLRTIDTFSLALQEDCGDKLDPEAQSHLARVRKATKRTMELIEDLLTLSRLTQAEMTRQYVDLGALSREVLAELQKRDPERRVEIVIADGLTADGDERLLRGVLENLLGNAWKFTGKRASARIELGAIPQKDGRPAYYVRDNGAGFDMKFADKLFNPFHRLHKASDFPGTGVGLATVQRIINRHGGRLWAESAVDQGATFYFTL